MSPPVSATDPPWRSAKRRSLLARAGAIVMIVGTVVFWVWIFSGAPKRTNPDRLDDRSIVVQAHQRCRDLRQDLDQLPAAETAKTATDRAGVLARANDLVEEMIDDLDALEPDVGDDARRMRGWLDDWRTYLGDRTAYATALRSDPSAQMTVSENDALSDGVDKTIEVFADVNDMPDCATPGDVG